VAAGYTQANIPALSVVASFIDAAKESLNAAQTRLGGTDILTSYLTSAGQVLDGVRGDLMGQVTQLMASVEDFSNATLGTMRNTIATQEHAAAGANSVAAML
jgi:hypothetical protein